MIPDKEQYIVKYDISTPFSIEDSLTTMLEIQEYNRQMKVNIIEERREMLADIVDKIGVEGYKKFVQIISDQL